MSPVGAAGKKGVASLATSGAVVADNDHWSEPKSTQQGRYPALQRWGRWPDGCGARARSLPLFWRLRSLIDKPKSLGETREWRESNKHYRMYFGVHTIEDIRLQSWANKRILWIAANFNNYFGWTPKGKSNT